MDTTRHLRPRGSAREGEKMGGVDRRSTTARSTLNVNLGRTTNTANACPSAHPTFHASERSDVVRVVLCFGRWIHIPPPPFHPKSCHLVNPS